MKNTTLFIVLLLTISILTYGEEPDTTRMGEITVTITDLNNLKGNVEVALFDNSKAFPGDREKTVREKWLPIKDTSFVKTKFEKLPFGTYAFVAFHDENKNKELDSNLFGIPSEGVGVSNDAKGALGPPSFEDSKFELKKKKMNIQFKMRY